MSPIKSTVIAKMFANQVALRNIVCPVCEQKATIKEIDAHLNQGCPYPATKVQDHSRSPSQDVFNDSDTDYDNLDGSSRSTQPSKVVLPASNDVKVKTPSPKKSKFSFSSRVTSKTSPSKNLTSMEDSENYNSDHDEDNHSAHVPLTQSKRQDPNHIPYYLLNFETIVRGVIDETDDVRLFDKEDLCFVNIFRDLSLDARKLYVRLFQRKFTWILSSAINYDEIHAKDQSLEELVKAKLLNDGSQLEDLEATLKLLPAGTVRKICKDLNLASKGSHKQDFMETLISHSKKKSFFGPRTSMHQLIIKKASQYVSECYILVEEPRKVFLRIFSLYSLSNWWDERENDKGQPAQMTTLLLQNTGRIVFPTYEIIRHAHIFRHKADLLLFERSINFESRISEVTDSKDFEMGPPIAEECREFFDEILGNADMQTHVSNLPTFLRKFTSGSVMAYVLTKCVEIFERLKNYSLAVSLLQLLLSQNLYLPDYHGLWFERLALDTDCHLRMPEEALNIINKSLSDENVRVARRLTLCQRALKICQAKKNSKLKEKYLELMQGSPHWICPSSPPHKTIQGKMVPKDNLPGGKSVFVYEFCKNIGGELQVENALCSVEEFVHEYYKNELGFTHGLHAEGTLINTVCWLLFWDIVYDEPVPDAFRGPHQASPLDLSYDVFYTNRKAAFDTRLEKLETWSFDHLSEFVTEKWAKCSYSTASLCQWDLFKDASEICGLLKCLSGYQWRAICERLIKNHRHTRSGFPDLTLWNPEKQILEFVEVKGPNDVLSAKQILWLEYLNAHGITALVCHVEALNGRKLLQTKKVSPEKIKEEKQPMAKKRNRKVSEDDFV